MESKMNRKITSIVIALVTVAALSCTVLASSIMGGAGMNVTESGGGMNGSGSGMGSTGGMSGNTDDGMSDSFGMSSNDDVNSSTLGDLDGDGVIENENGMGFGLTDDGGSMGGTTADDGMLDTTGSGRSGVDPISETTPMAEDGATDSAMSWTAIIVAVLLAAALIAVVIALIPKKNKD